MDLEVVNKVEIEKHHFFPDAPPHHLQSLDIAFGMSPWVDCDDEGLTVQLRKLFGSDDTLNGFKSPPQPIENLDVVSLFEGKKGGNNNNYLVRYGSGERVKAEDVLKDKYVLVFAFSVPCLWCNTSEVTRGLSALCAELAAKKRNEVEMVMVVKMRPGWDDDEDAFNQFFSAFPDCLAVPFEHKQRRESIFKALYSGNSFIANGVFVDPEGKVVQKRLSRLYYYGVNAFPFTDESLSAYAKKEDKLKKRSTRRGTLERILGCSVLRRNTDDVGVPLSEIEKNPVGLYFCCSGDFFKELGGLYRQCRDKGLPFEIVVICFSDPSHMEQSKFEALVERGLKKNNISCYILPFDNSVCRRLWRWSGFPREDKLLVLAPGKSSLEAHGEEVFETFGIKGYPFTMRSIIEKEVTRLRKLEWKSVASLLPEYVCRKRRNGKVVKVPVARLEGKNILLYLDYIGSYPERESVGLRDNLISWYRVIKRKDPEFEMLYICLVSKSDRCLFDHELLSGIPWLVCPYDPVSSVSVAKLLQARICGRKVVAFGENGKICSLPQQIAMDADPFKENLEKDVVASLKQNHAIFFEHY